MHIIVLDCFNIPLNIGQIFHTPRPPILNNCPKEVSNRKVGIPARNNVSIYGIKKAPEKYKRNTIRNTDLTIQYFIKLINNIYFSIEFQKTQRFP